MTVFCQARKSAPASFDGMAHAEQIASFWRRMGLPQHPQVHLSLDSGREEGQGMQVGSAASEWS